MFGVLAGAVSHLPRELRAEWVGHVCGLCLTLRDAHGQAARLATNEDAALLSVLTSAQRDQAPQTYRQVCPLRGFRAADVVDARDSGAQLAAAVATTMVAAKVRDHADDRDGVLGKAPRLAHRAATRVDSWADRSGRRVRAPVAVVRRHATSQARLERTGESSFDRLVAPTEEAAAAVFRHTAELAGRPENIAALDEAGRAFGRIVYLLDAVADHDDDLATGACNPLARAYPGRDPNEVAWPLFRAAHRRLTSALARATLPRPALAHALLGSALASAGAHTIRGISCASRTPRQRPGWREGATGACGLGVLCVDVMVICSDAVERSNCDCCCCDDVCTACTDACTTPIEACGQACDDTCTSCSDACTGCTDGCTGACDGCTGACDGCGSACDGCGDACSCS